MGKFNILHTSDWHIGVNVHDIDRLPQQREMLAQLSDIIDERHIDALIVSGDLYDIARPSAMAERMLNDGLVALHHRFPTLRMVITAGNHDSMSGHETFRTPWQLLGVDMIGRYTVGREDDLIVEIPGKGFIVAVPYINERNLPEGLYQQLLDMVSERNTEQLPVVLMAHTAVHGCQYSGHANATENTIGGIDSVDIASFGSGYDYLALGHIHQPHTLSGGSATARYSGSPVAVSFDEDYAHTVSIVSLESRGGKVDVEEVDINTSWPLVTIPSSGKFEDFETVLQKLTDFPADAEAYIRLNVEIDDFLPPSAMDSARQAAEGKACKVVYINSRRKGRRSAEEDTPDGFTIAEFKTLAPIDLAARYADENGIDFSDELRQMFTEASQYTPHS